MFKHLFIPTLNNRYRPTLLFNGKTKVIKVVTDYANMQLTGDILTLLFQTPG